MHTCIFVHHFGQNTKTKVKNFYNLTYIIVIGTKTVTCILV